MHVFTASVGTETNTFSPMPTGEGLFAATYLARRGDYGATPDLFALPMVCFRDRARAKGWRVTEGVCTFAVPAGPTLDRVYRGFRDEVLADLKRAMPVNAVLLSLHGAMVCETIESGETDLVAAVRAIVGPRVPIGVELDLHCHLTPGLVATADAIVIFKEYPHIDAVERAGEVFTIIAAMLEKGLKPRSFVFDCRMLGLYPTVREPMAGIVREIKALEGKDGVVSVSIAHGFPWGDVTECGTKVLVITDGRDGSALAREIGIKLRALRGQIEPPWMEMNAALDLALASPGPVIMGDVCDNAGGGAASDSTPVLRELLRRGVKNAALGCLWDPGVVALAFEAGEGARMTLRLGGKLGPMSGDPLDVQGTVMKLGRELHQSYLGGKAAMGDAAAIRIDGIDVIVNSNRCQTFSPDAFSQLGVDPRARHVTVVKSMNHFRAEFEPIAKSIIYCAAPGAIDVQYARLPFRRVRRPIYPLDANAWD